MARGKNRPQNNNRNSFSESNNFHNQSLTSGLQTTGGDNSYRRPKGGKQQPNNNEHLSRKQARRDRYINKQRDPNHSNERRFQKFLGTNNMPPTVVNMPPTAVNMPYSGVSVPQNAVNVHQPAVAMPSPSRPKEQQIPKEKTTHPPSVVSTNHQAKSEKSAPAKPVPEIKIKQEKIDETTKAPKETIVKAVAPAPAPSSSSSSSSSSDSSSEDDSSSSSSSSDEKEIPKMPNPMNNKGVVKVKKEFKEDDVVCLGIPNNVQNLVDDEETHCLVCNTQGHSPAKCQMKCTKCSQSSYETQVVCKNCGETYPKTSKVTLPNQPNPFLMFMQFMQFCMSQYSEFGGEMYQPVPGPVPVQGPTQSIEVTRQDIVNSKHRSKKVKSESKRSRKKRKSEKNDSDSSSDTTVSTKRRKKQEIVQPTPIIQPTQYPLPNMPLPGGFNSHGFNPMMAFTQMMGYNPTTMNLPR